MKRKIALLMVMVILMSTTQINYVSAAEKTTKEVENEAEGSETDIKVPLELSIEDAIKLATESDRKMWAINDSIKQAEAERRQGRSAKESAEDLMDAPLSETSDLGITNGYLKTILDKNGYYIKLADTKAEELKKSKDVLTIGIEIGTKSLYYNVLAAEKTIEINETKLNSANEQLRVINLKFNNGSATKAEVLGGEMSVQQAQTDLDSVNDDLKIAKLDLLNALDLSLETEIILTDKELKYVPTKDVSLGKAIEKAKAERPEILSAENALEVQKIETHAYKAYYTSNLRQYKAAEEKLKDAELNIPQAYKDVDLDIRKLYLSLVKAERELVNMDKTVEIAREAARVNKLLYENGMAASLDVIEANAKLAQAEIGRYQLLVAYNLNKLKFDNSNLYTASAGMQ